MRLLLPVVLSTVLVAGCTAPPSDEWRLVFSDSGTGDWTDGWFLEGEKATVENTPGGMVFSAGPVPKEDASHAVLWTKRSFVGDLKVEYDYTRLDSMMSVDAVNILYIQASGLGTDESPTDIAQSTTQRSVPAMSEYYLNMNALHISYATTGPRRAHYVSARRYPADTKDSFPSGTQIQPIYENVELFEPGRSYHMTVVKEGALLSFTVKGNGRVRTFEWDTTQFAPVTEGRIGLRHMWARSARYSDLRVYVKD
jgi:hypothetical protein